MDGRGGDHTAEGGGGGRLAPEPQGSPHGVRAVPKTFTDDFPEDSLPDEKDIGSPVDMFEAIVLSNCDLRRHLDSVPPETPIRDIVDRCRVWEGHADQSSRRLTKPSPDPIYPAYVVGDADYDIETTRVAEVTGQKSKPHQLKDLLRRVLTTAERPAPKPEVPDVEKLLQQLVRETQSRPTAVVNPSVTTTLEQMLRSNVWNTTANGHNRDVRRSSAC